MAIQRQDITPPEPISLHARHIDARRVKEMVERNPEIFQRQEPTRLPVMDWTQANADELERIHRENVECVVIGVLATAIVLVALWACLPALASFVGPVWAR